MRTPRVHLEEFDELLACLYEGALDEAARTAALDELNRFLKASACQVHILDAASGELIETAASSSSCHAHMRTRPPPQGALQDPRQRIARGLASGQVARCHEWLDDDSVCASRFYQEFLIPAGYRWTLFGLVDCGDGTAVLVEVLRGQDAPAFEEWTETALGWLLPHFRRAECLRNRYLSGRVAHADIFAMVEHLPVPACVIEERGRLLVHNAAASRLLSELPACRPGQSFRFSPPEVHQQWSHALDQSRRRCRVESLVIQPDGRVCWILHLVPWRLFAPHADRAVATLILLVLERRGLPARMEIEQFAASSGLTKAEAEVLGYLLEGCSTKEIAIERGSSPNTVKSQLRSILEKSHCRTQRELMSRFQWLMHANGNGRKPAEG